jgi:D-tyrosyl-tRNA(Tyr) deacylase
LRAVVTRVTSASVTIDGAVTGRIGQGFLVLVGIAPSDTPADAVKLADKILGLRIFEDAQGKMNMNLAAGGGSLLIVPQFTLYADIKSRRPSFSGAARPDIAIPLYEQLIAVCRDAGYHTETGTFGADMKVASVNDGPVTIVIDTDMI